MRLRYLRVLPAVLAAAGIIGFGARQLYSTATASSPARIDSSLPTAAVKRGDVPFTVAAKGDLQGGNSEMLVAPMTGSGAMSITFLRESGELVHEGDVVVTAGVQALRPGQKVRLLGTAS